VVEAEIGACDLVGMTTSFDMLSQRIEEVIQEHLTASRVAAADAVARAFGSMSRESGRSRVRLAAPSTGGSQRRTAPELAALGQQFYRAVCAKPGETMAVLAAEVGASPRLLNRPVTQLRRLGQVRSVGQRNLTRHFPLATKS
jgi:hypothetical protein